MEPCWTTIWLRVYRVNGEQLRVEVMAANVGLPSPQLICKKIYIYITALAGVISRMVVQVATLTKQIVESVCHKILGCAYGL